MYLTIQGPAEGKITEKMSRFLAFAWPVADAAEAREVAARYQKEYHDARHVCWAYVTGADRAEQYSNDNGGAVRHGRQADTRTDQFAEPHKCGGGCGALFRRYQTRYSGADSCLSRAARAALDAAATVERHELAEVSFHFPYQSMNSVMALAKMPQVEIADREFDNTCRMTLRTRRDMMDALVAGLGKIDGVTMAGVRKNA